MMSKEWDLRGWSRLIYGMRQAVRNGRSCSRPSAVLAAEAGTAFPLSPVMLRHSVNKKIPQGS